MWKFELCTQYGQQQYNDFSGISSNILYFIIIVTEDKGLTTLQNKFVLTAMIHRSVGWVLETDTLNT